MMERNLVENVASFWSLKKYFARVASILWPVRDVPIEHNLIED